MKKIFLICILTVLFVVQGLPQYRYISRESNPIEGGVELALSGKMVSVLAFTLEKERPYGIWLYGSTKKKDFNTFLFGLKTRVVKNTELGWGAGFVDVYGPIRHQFFSHGFFMFARDLFGGHSNLIVTCDISRAGFHQSIHWYDIVQVYSKGTAGVWNESEIVGLMMSFTFKPLFKLNVGPGYDLKNLGPAIMLGLNFGD
jgi:hypothetical protein